MEFKSFKEVMCTTNVHIYVHMIYLCIFVLCIYVFMYFSNAFNNQFIIGPPAWPNVITNIIMYVHTHTADTYKFLYCMICPCNCN